MIVCIILKNPKGFAEIMAKRIFALMRLDRRFYTIHSYKIRLYRFYPCFVFF